MKETGPREKIKSFLRSHLFKRGILALVALAVLVLLPASTSEAADYPDAYDMVADPITSRFFETFSPSTIENGRVWVDKSVSTGSNTFHDLAGNPILTIDSASNEFLVTLSALSQSYSIDTVVEPTDTVFVLDVSASMDVYTVEPGSPDSRAEVMVRALNGAIRSIMEASPQNRVAVVAYGGYAGGGFPSTNLSRTVRLMALDHYDLAEDQDYLSINDPAFGSPQISVNSLLPAVTRSVAVEGGTSTQRGIYEGAQILYENNDITYTYAPEEGADEITITRRPTIVLLTDGEPTFGWRDYTLLGALANTDNGYDSGSGNPTNIDMGIDLLTVLTASYWKQKVSDHYYPDGNKLAHFYTIGVGVSGVHAPAVMDPVNNAQNNTQVYNGQTYNMKTLLDQFVNSGSTNVPVVNKGTNPSPARSLVPLENDGGYVKSWAYTDGYYPVADDQALEDAFDSIAYDIISQGNYTTGADPQKPDFSGYVVFSDTIGEHMRFSEFKGIVLGGQLHDGKAFAQAVLADRTGELAQEFAAALAERLTTPDRTVTEGEVLDLINGSIEAGLIYYHSDEDFGCVIRAYADENVDFLGPYYDEYGDPIDPPPSGAECFVDWFPMSGQVVDEVTGEFTDLIHTYLSVTTSLETGEFGLRGETGQPVPEIDIHIYEEQQLVRWYVPASLIPMRTVSQVEEGGEVTGLEIRETLPIRANYTVRLRPDFDLSLLGQYYKDANHTPDHDGYYFYSNDWRFEGGTTAFDTSIALFEPNTWNPYYYFTADKTRLYVRDGAGYVPASGSVDPNTTYYWLKEYFDSTVPGYIAQEYVAVDPEVTDILADDEGPYVPEGQPKTVTFATIDKTSNPTDTYLFRLDGSFHPPREDYPGATEIFLLGNNGRLTVPITSVSARKVWEGEPLESVWVQLYADGKPVQAYDEAEQKLVDAPPIQLNAGNSWEHTWPEVLVYQLEMDAEGEVDLIQYTVAEGTYEGGVFTPYSETNPLESDGTTYAVHYRQLAWYEETGTWSDAVITNAQLPDATIRLEKAISGIAQTDEVFSFTLTQVVDEAGTDEVEPGISRTVETAGTIGSAGQEVSFVIGALTEGTYYFRITEDPGSSSEWGYSTDSYVVTVEVEEGEATVIYPGDNPDAPPVFTNTYKPPPSAVIRAMKRITSIAQTDEVFSFTLTQVVDEAGSEEVSGGITLTAQTTGTINSSTGQEVSFPAIENLSDDTTYYFKITEDPGSTLGWTYSTQSYVVTVEVEKGEATVIYPDGSPPVFANAYTPPPGSATLRLQKAVTGTSATGEVFNFTLTQVVDEAGSEEVSGGITLTAQTTGTINGSTGQMVSFPEITNLGQGTYYFEITEDPGGASGWTYSSESYVVTVDVAGGQTIVTYPGEDPDDPPVFTNIYTPTPPFVNLSLKKAISGTSATNEVFRFTLTQVVDGDGSQEVEGGISRTIETTGTINSSTGQVVTFPVIENLSDDTTYYFKITEDPGGAAGWTHFPESYVVTVEVAGGVATVISPEDYGDNLPVFTNTPPPPPDVNLSLKKAISGLTETDEVFTFTLTQVDGDGEEAAPVPGGISRTAHTTGTIGNAGQVVSFPEITNLGQGTYYFKITEDLGSASGWTYSTQSYRVAVVVENGQVTVTYPGDYDDESPPVFTNTYATPPTTPPTGPPTTEPTTTSTTEQTTPPTTEPTTTSTTTPTTPTTTTTTTPPTKPTTTTTSPATPSSSTTTTAAITPATSTPSGGSPRTGDDSNLPLWITLCALSLSGLVAVAIGGRRWGRKG